jgi:hypothetical protein
MPTSPEEKADGDWKLPNTPKLFLAPESIGKIQAMFSLSDGKFE